MSLRTRAEADARAILENTSDGGQAITLTDPDATPTVMTGFTGDVSTAIDPDTGAIVAGRTVHVSLAIASLPAGARPAAQPDATLKPWLVSFPRIVGGAVTQYAVVRSQPDDSLGYINLELGNYKP